MTILLSQLPSAPAPPALTDTAVGVGGGVTAYQYTFAQVAQTIGAATSVVPSIAALRNYGSSSLASGSLIYVQGYASIGDGGEGFFVWNASSTASDDGGTVIDPTWNNNPQPGPNLITNGNFASGQTGWTVSSGSPTFTGNQCSNAGNSFCQIKQSLTGLTPNSTYIISMTYTMASSPGGGFIGVGPPPNPVVDQFTTEASPTVWTFTFGQGSSTTNTFQVGFGNSLITFTNIVFQLAAGGRFLRVIDQPNVCEPEWWGAQGSGGADDYAALNSAFNFAQSAPNQLNMGCRGIVKMGAARRYLSNTGLSFNPSLMSIDGNNSFIDFSNIASNPSAGGCLALIGNTESGFLLPYGTNIAAIQNLGIYTSLSYPYIAGIKGIFIGGADTVQGTTLSHVNVRGFETGINLSSNTYQITLHRCYVLNTVTCFSQLSNPSNSGEMNVIDSCSFFNSVCGIDFQNSNGSLFVIHTSIDYNSIFARTLNGHLRFSRCHFETNDAAGVGLLPGSSTLTSGTYFDCNGPYTAAMELVECEIVETGSSSTSSVLFYAAVGSGGIRVHDPYWGGGGWGSSIPMTLVPTVGGMQPLLSTSDITFSNSNNTLLAGSGGGVDQGITNLNLTALVGKWIFTVTLNNTVALIGNPQLCVGIATPTTGGLNNGIQGAYATTGNFGGGLPPGGDVWLVSHGHIGSPQAVPATFTAGTVWWFAYDSVHGKFWFSSDLGTTWNGGANSPDGNTGGFSIGSTGGGPVVQFANAGDQMTVNFNPSTSGIPNVTTFAPAINTFTLSGGGPVEVQRSFVQYNSSTWPMPVMMDINNGLPADPTFESSTVSTGFLDPWLLYADTAPITSPYTGTNISISISTAKPFSGVNSLAAVKAGAAASVAKFAFMSPCLSNEMHTWAIEYAASANSLGTFQMSVYYARLLYYNSSGLPVFGQVTSSYNTTLTPTTTYQSSISSQSARPQAPSFATHALFVFDMLSMGAGTLYIDNAQFYRL